jgi:hypothetical protein
VVPSAGWEDNKSVQINKPPRPCVAQQGGGVSHAPTELVEWTTRCIESKSAKSLRHSWAGAHLQRFFDLLGH